jgi:hypothetical protein
MLCLEKWSKARELCQDTRPQGRESKPRTPNYQAGTFWLVESADACFVVRDYSTALNMKYFLDPEHKDDYSSRIAYVISDRCRRASQFKYSIYAFLLVQPKHTANTVFHFKAGQTLRSKDQIQIMRYIMLFISWSIASTVLVTDVKEFDSCNLLYTGRIYWESNWGTRPGATTKQKWNPHISLRYFLP